MLSRFSLCGGQTFKKCLLKLQPVPAITSSAASSSSANVGSGSGAAAAAAAAAASAAPPEFPPPSSKRDFANFPRPTKKDRPPPVRLGFIPDTWFQFFYPKTGYTGPYMFLISLGTYMYSKEIIIHDHNTIQCYAFIILCMVLHNKFGDKIGAVLDKLMEKEDELLDGGQEQEKQQIRDSIAELEKTKSGKDAISEVLKARTEVIHLQMELAYRDRVAQTHKMVKQALDCQAELESADRRIKQRNLVDYVLGNVMKSITPDLEKSAMQACINDLNALSAKA